MVQDEAELRAQMPQAQAEAQAAFGYGGVYLERYLRARHRRQVLGDGKNAIHLYERECSLQRRRQKVFEEAPSPALDAATRQRLCESAAQLARSVAIAAPARWSSCTTTAVVRRISISSR